MARTRKKLERTVDRDIFDRNILFLVIALILIAINSFILLDSLPTITGGVSGLDSSVGLCVISTTPVFLNVSNQTLTAGNRFNHTLNCSYGCGCQNTCGPVITFGAIVSPTLPSFSLDSQTGVINFTPTTTEVGEYDVLVSCDNKFITPLTSSFTLVVSSGFGPQQMNISVYNNHSINLSWSNASGAAYYNVYYSSNLSSIMNLSFFSIAPDVKNASNITTLNWSDTNASGVERRYYIVSSVNSSSESLSSDLPVGKFTYQYTALNSSVYGLLASNRIAIYLNKSYTAESFLQEIPASLNPTISRLDKSNSSGEYLTTHVRGLSDGNNFDLEASRGYQVTVDGSHNQTIAGKVYNEPYTLSLEVPTSRSYGILTTNWEGIYEFNRTYTAESFLQEISASLNPTISQLNKSNTSGEFLTTHVRGLSDGNNFPVVVGRGYQITVDSDLNHTLCTNCFN